MVPLLVAMLVFVFAPQNEKNLQFWLGVGWGVVRAVVLEILKFITTEQNLDSLQITNRVLV